MVGPSADPVEVLDHSAFPGNASPVMQYRVISRWPLKAGYKTDALQLTRQMLIEINHGLVYWAGFHASPRRCNWAKNSSTVQVDS